MNQFQRMSTLQNPFNASAEPVPGQMERNESLQDVQELKAKVKDLESRNVDLL